MPQDMVYDKYTRDRPNRKQTNRSVQNVNDPLSYMLSRDYRVAGYQYSRLLFTSEDHICANLRVQWQVNLT